MSDELENPFPSEDANERVTAIDGIPVPTDSPTPEGTPQGDRVTAIDGIPVPTDSPSPSSSPSPSADGGESESY